MKQISGRGINYDIPAFLQEGGDSKWKLNLHAFRIHLQVLALFSQHDDFIIDFLGEDKIYYTRYNSDEKIDSVWLAYDGIHPAGCIACRKKPEGVMEVKRLFIQKEYRGRGISKMLLTALENHARELGYGKLFLDTRITLEPAVSLYRKSGFEIIFKQGLYVQLEKKL